jgi:hypothetical protein
MFALHRSEYATGERESLLTRLELRHPPGGYVTLWRADPWSLEFASNKCIQAFSSGVWLQNVDLRHASFYFKFHFEARKGYNWDLAAHVTHWYT